MHILFPLVLVACTTGSKNRALELINTPFGMFPSECVIEHPNGTMIEEFEGGVKATHADGTVKIYPLNEMCKEYFEKQKEAQLKSDKESPNGELMASYGPISNTNSITSFSADYTVPPNPVKFNDSTAFSYWIGLQDPGSPVPNPNTVLQPVLAYWGPNQTWSLEPWHCCIGGRVHSGSFISGIQPENVATGAIKKIDSMHYKVSFAWGEKETSLITKIEKGAIFNWMLILLEENGNELNCDLLPQGTMTFSNIQISDSTGTVMPAWSISDKNSCLDISTDVDSLTMHPPANN